MRKLGIVLLAVVFGIFLLGCAQQQQATPTPAPTPTPTATTTPPPTKTPSEWVPEKPITIIVPWKAGGGTDTYARIVAKHWSKYMPGHPTFVVVNKEGGGGVIGTTAVYTAKPDGYTIGLTIAQAMIINQLTSNVQFDMKKFEVLGGPSVYTRVIFVNPKTIGPKVNSWEDLKKILYDVNIATYGFGSTAHIAPILHGKLSGEFDPEKLHFVHYSGTSGVVAAFQRGEADVYWGAAEAHKKYVDEGIFKPIMVYSNEPHKLFPDLPTTVSAGIPHAKEINAALWDPKVFVAPPGTPKLVVDTLSKSLWKTLNDPECIKDAEKAKRPITPVSKEELDKFISQAFETWSKQTEVLKIIKEGG